MTTETSAYENILSWMPHIDIPLGGAGNRSARLARELRFRRVEKRLRIAPDEVQDLRRELAVLSHLLCIDAEAPEIEVFTPSFANMAKIVLEPPKDYIFLQSYSGSELMELAKTPPFAHLERSTVPLSQIEGKNSRCEAQQNRLYGKVNIETNIQPVDRMIEAAVQQVYTAEKKSDWLRLIGRGIHLDKLPVINVFFSTAGGQGSGSILPVLALLALHLEGRPRPRIYVHLLLPGFHPSIGEQEDLNNDLRTRAVLHDLAALKAGAEMRIPFPNKDKFLRSKHSRELFDTLFIHKPVEDHEDGYDNFIRRVSSLVVSLELAAFARDTIRTRSNVPQFEDDNKKQRQVAACEGVHDEPEKSIRDSSSSAKDND